MMNANNSELHSILFAADRELENFKFFPGDDPNLTPEVMCAAAAKAVQEAIDCGLEDNPPQSGQQKSRL